MFFPPQDKTNKYIRELTGCPQDGLLSEMAGYAAENHVPIILPEASAFLKTLLEIKKPESVLEIGTAIGYSAHIILSSCDAELCTVEKDEGRIGVAKEYLGRAGFLPRVRFFSGDAGDIVPFLSGSFDFIFLDGPKTRYIEYLPYLKRLLPLGGILLCDNVLFGKMVTGEREPGKKLSIAAKLDMFLRNITSDSDFVTSVIPLGDGLSLSVKKS